MDTGTTEKHAMELVCSGSDEHHDLICFPCSLEYKNVSASKYCKDCSYYLCGTCLNQHNRFAAMTLHEVVEINEAGTLPAGEEVPTLPTLKCIIHHGKLLEMYCKEHNDVCCIICMTVKHGSCKGMSYIPTAAQGIDVTTTLGESQTKLKDRKSKLVLLNEEKKKMKDKLMVQTKSWKKIIQDERHMVEEHIGNLETQLLGEMTEITGNIVRKAETHAKEVDHAIHTLEKSEKLLTIGRSNQSDLFIKSIQIQHQLKDADDLHQREQMERQNVDQLLFKQNKNLSKQLKGIDSLGKMIYAKAERSSDAFSIHLHKNVDITSENEHVYCDISGACILTDGHILLVDCKNRSIKKLNESYELSSILQVSAIPWSVCTVNSTTVAVSMWNEQKVQLVWVQGEMKLCSSFPVSDRCSGIYHKDEKLYVCVGGMRYGDEGVVEIYTLSGIKLNTIANSLRKPRSVVVLGETVIVADEEKGLVEIENEDNTVVHGTKGLVKAHSLCVDKDGIIFISGKDSNNVFTFSVEDGLFKSVLTENDGIRKPQLLCFHQEKSRIMVGLENCNFLKVYSLEDDYDFTNF